MKKARTYEEMKAQLEKEKQLLEQMKGRRLTAKEQQRIHMSIDNYEYILNLLDMNHFNRGIQQSPYKKKNG